MGFEVMVLVVFDMFATLCGILYVVRSRDIRHQLRRF